MCNERQITKNFSDLVTSFKQLITSINIYHFYTYILLAYQLLLHAFTSTCNYNYDIALTVNSIIKKKLEGIKTQTKDLITSYVWIKTDVSTDVFPDIFRSLIIQFSMHCVI